MDDTVPVQERVGHHLREAVNERGLLEPEEDAPRGSRLFVPIMIVLPIALFLIVLSW